MHQHTMNKEKWIHVFQAIGLDEATMNKWHHEFENRYPQEHAAFLEWLQIPSHEIEKIRENSRSA